MGPMFFFKNFLKDKDVASVAPSSKFAVKRVCGKLDFRRKKIIVEYGPGTGVFSKFILKKMGPQSKLILIETNKNFCSHLRKIRDKRVVVFNDTAENVKKVLGQCGEKTADYIISGIPFSYFKKGLKAKIIRNTYDSLSDGGKFIVYQCSGHLKKYLQSYFGPVCFDFEVLNVPPLFIFEAVK